jgi:hypothetical protein
MEQIEYLFRKYLTCFYLYRENGKNNFHIEKEYIYGIRTIVAPDHSIYCTEQ